MASIGDRWHTKGTDGELRKTSRHPDNGGSPRAKRWRVRYIDGDWRERSLSFRRKFDAEQFADRLGKRLCLVLPCCHPVATEEPVLLCKDHLDLLLMSIGRKRPGMHDPLIYFARNGPRVKIGWTTNLKSRMSSLSLRPDAVVFTLPGGPAEEDMFHRRFGSCRVGRTEWFEETGGLAAFIGKHETTEQLSA